jgi:hypothetical protein
MVQTSKEVPQVGLVDPADWLSRNDFMQGRQRVMGAKPWTATKRARQKVLLVDRRQDIGNAPLEDTVTNAWYPEWAQLVLSRLRDVGPSHWRWSVPLGV